MANRVNIADLRGMFTRCMKAAEYVGLDVTDWRLSTGSKANGISYNLGQTANEAYDTLYALALAFEAVAKHSPFLASQRGES